MDKDFSQKSALVIQGPILSKGKSGKHFGDPDLPVEDSFFDCSELINDIVKESKESFDLIVISTWDSEDTSKIIELDKIRIIKSKQPIYRISKKSEPNTFKQFYSILRGLDVAYNEECKFVVKIRTDTWVEATKVLDLIKTDPTKIWVVPFKSPNCITDFFFGGNITNMQIFTDTILKPNFFYRTVYKSASIHYSLFYQYAYRQESVLKRLFFWNYYYSYFLSLSKVRTIKSAWENFYSQIPQEIYNSMKWRGFGIPIKSQHTETELDFKFENWTQIQLLNSKTISYIMSITLHFILSQMRKLSYILHKFR